MVIESPVVFIELNNASDALNISPTVCAILRDRFPSLRPVLLNSYDELCARIAQPHIVLCWRFDRELYGRADNLRLVLTPAAGRDWVADDPRSIATVYHGAFHGHLIAESLLSAMFHFNDRRSILIRAQNSHEWARNAQFPRTLLKNQRALIIGYGSIGRHCARLLRAVGMHVTGLKRAPVSDTDTVTGARIAPFARLHEELPDADHVVLLLPGGDSTRGSFGPNEFRTMKRSSYLYNFGRGTVIDESALVTALSNGTIAGAALDVFGREPLESSSPLWDLENVLITPHSSCHYEEYATLFAAEAVGELIRRAAELGLAAPTTPPSS